MLNKDLETIFRNDTLWNELQELRSLYIDRLTDSGTWARYKARMKSFKAKVSVEKG